MRRRKAPAIAAGLFTVASAAVVVWLLSDKGLNSASAILGVASFCLAVLTAAAALLPGSLIAELSPADMDSVADALARELGIQWADADRTHQVNDPRPLDVRWAPIAGSGALGAKASGRFGDILAAFNDVPGQRLIVLGPAGAGKSILITRLARELLRVRQPGMPVPVIFPAATWTTEEGLQAWFTRQLARNHTGLARKVRTATGQVTTLAAALASHSLLPIIDGLDELPRFLRAQAIRGINASGADQPLVLTSRPAEYFAAIKTAGREISHATVIELLPLQMAEVKRYLDQAAPSARWGTIFGQLDEDPEGPLGAVLTAPLMVWLARTIYEDGPNDPADLADRNRFPDPDTVENYLLDAFVPAVYTNQAAQVRTRYTPGSAQRWLGFIAYYLDRADSPDLDWWQLPGAVRGLAPVGAAVRGVLLTAIAWGLTVWVLWQQGDWRDGHYSRHDSLHYLLLSGPLGRLSQATVHPLFTLGQRGVIETQAAIAKLLPWGSLPDLELRVALAAAGLSVFSMFRQKASTAQPKEIKITFRGVALAVFLPPFSIIVGIIGVISLLSIGNSAYEAGYALGIIAHSSSAWLVVSFFGLVGLVCVPGRFKADIRFGRSVSPDALLRLDRRAAFGLPMLQRAALALLVLLWCGWPLAVAYVAFAAAAATCARTLGGWRYASWRLADARCWLAGCGLLPWRPMRFLADAHQRGVLRQVGTAYQFRHIRLQQRLASEHTPWPSRLLRWPRNQALRLISHLAEEDAQADVDEVSVLTDNQRNLANEPPC